MNATAGQTDLETSAEPVNQPTGMEAPIGYGPYGKASEGKGSAKKKGSRWNSLRHGLDCARAVPPRSSGADRRVHGDSHRALQAGASPYERRLLTEMGGASAQVEHGRNLQVIDQQRGMDRAVLCCEFGPAPPGRRARAKLSSDPPRISRALESTKQGVDWKIQAWEDLGEVIEVAGSWGPAHLALAFDLLGVRAEMRATSRKVPAATDTATLGGLVRRELDRLREALASCLAPLDRAAQAMTEVGPPGTTTPSRRN